MVQGSNVEDKLPVWTALSELFLDTELTDIDLAHIADVLAESAFGIEELAHILFDEVLPVFGPNLLSVAGEWAAWDQSQVREIMMTAAARRTAQKRVGRMLALFVKKPIEAEWKRLVSLVESRRA